MAKKIKCVNVVNDFQKDYKGRKVHSDNLDLSSMYNLRIEYGRDGKTASMTQRRLNGTELLAILDGSGGNNARAYVQQIGGER